MGRQAYMRPAKHRWAPRFAHLPRAHLAMRSTVTLRSLALVVLPAAVSAITPGFSYGNTTVRGVNLGASGLGSAYTRSVWLTRLLSWLAGGWLVLEVCASTIEDSLCISLLNVA